MSNSDFNQPMDIVEDSESPDVDANMFLEIDTEQHQQLQEFQAQFPEPTVDQIRTMAEVLQTDERSVKEWYRRYANEVHGDHEYEVVEEEEVYFNPEVEELKREHADEMRRQNRLYAKLDIYTETLKQQITKLKSDLQASKENEKILEGILEAKEAEIQEKNSRIERLQSGIQEVEGSESLKKNLESAEKDLIAANKKLMDLEYENGENLKKIDYLRHILETERVRVYDVKLQKKDEKIEELHDYIEDALKPRIKLLESENKDYHDSMLKVHHARVEDVEKIRHYEIQFQGFRSTIELLQNRIKSVQEDKDLMSEVMDADQEDTYERIQKLRRIISRYRRRVEERDEKTANLQNHLRILLMEADDKNEALGRLKKRLREALVEKEQWKTNFAELNREMNPEGEKENLEG